MQEFSSTFIQAADSLSLEENWSSFESTIANAADTFILHRAFYKAKSSNTHRSWERYRSLRKAVQKELRKQRKAEHNHYFVYHCLRLTPHQS